MKHTYLPWLVAGLLAAPLGGWAQALAAAPASPPPMVGGPPQPPYPTAAAPTQVSSANLALVAQLRHVLEQAPSRQPALLAELEQVAPQTVQRQASFRPDIMALATPAAVAGSPWLHTLTLAPGAAGVPAGGAMAGQRLRLLGATGEVLVLVARPAAPGSRVLLVKGAVDRGPVFVFGLEQPAVPTLNYEALVSVGLQATQALAEQVQALQQQLADLQQQLTAARQLNGRLLQDQLDIQDLKQQLNLLQSQQAATFSAAHQYRPFNRSGD